ncbi:MAG: hypothetical protein WDN06_05445 [Asticcacaulis sp.]
MRTRKNIVTALMGGVALAAIALAAIALPAPAAPNQDATPSATDVANTEVIVVGVRGSLAKSLHIKRDAPVIVDSINATELGPLPR